MKASTRNLVLALGETWGLCDTAYQSLRAIVREELGELPLRRLEENTEQAPNEQWFVKEDEDTSLAERKGLAWKLVDLMEGNGTIELPQGIVLFLHEGAGTVTSDLHEGCPFCGDPTCLLDCRASRETDEANTETPEAARRRVEYNRAIDGIEALILACGCAGVEVNSKEFKEAVDTAILAVANHLS